MPDLAIVVLAVFAWLAVSLVVGLILGAVMREPERPEPTPRPDYCLRHGWSFEHDPDCEIVLHPEWAREAWRQRLAREG